eukprot:382042_1
MAWLSKELHLDLKKALVSGYSREEYGLIPTDLIKIIRWYMDEVLYWLMEGKFLNKFCNKKIGQILYSSTYNYRDIEFCCYWYPNGNSANYQNQVIFGVTLSKLPSNIESLTIYYRLECKKFNCLWKSVHTFNNNKESALNSNCIGWNPFNMRLSKCKNVKKIDFNCYINVLRIIYTNKNSKCNKKSIEISAECMEPLLQITKHEWNINKYFINKLHKCDNGKTFYSSNFGSNENYCLFFAPKGFNQNNKNVKIDINTNQLMLYLRILRLPINIKIMTILYSIKINYTLINNNSINHCIKEIKNANVGYGFNECTKQLLFNKIPNILLLSSLQIYVKIQIQQIIDMNNKMIPKDHWDKYNIIINDNFTKIKQLFV